MDLQGIMLSEINPIPKGQKKNNNKMGRDGNSLPDKPPQNPK